MGRGTAAGQGEEAEPGASSKQETGGDRGRGRAWKRSRIRTGREAGLGTGPGTRAGPEEEEGAVRRKEGGWSKKWGRGQMQVKV